MLQFTKKWNWKWIVQYQRYFFRKLPAANISLCIFKAGLSGLSDGWAKCKEKVPDVSDSNQNVDSKLKFTDLKIYSSKGSGKTSQR